MPDSDQNPDPRLAPTPDYGTLGPGSDVNGGSAARPDRPVQASVSRGPLIAVAIGGFLAALVAGAGPRLKQLKDIFSAPKPAAVSATKDFAQLDHVRPQRQAETLLQLAIANSDGAVDQIFARVDAWRGKLKWTPLSPLFSAALDSKDMRVRAAGIEVELAAYGLPKTPAVVDYLTAQADLQDHAQKIWALWALGLLGNRGIETERVEQTLTSHFKDSDADSRRWAVESLALVGTDSTIPPLLQMMHDDPSPLVRERAACSLAESGMLTLEQRRSAVPQLVNYTDDPALDTQTHGWAFQALGDITHQALPRDSNAWRQWYESNRNP